MESKTLRRPRHSYEPGGVYFITTNTLNNEPFFDSDANKQLLLDDLQFYREKFKYKLFCFVIMPTHFHWMIQLSLENFEEFKRDQIGHHKKYSQDPESYYLSKIMEDLERHAAFAVNERENAKGRSIWQEGFWDEPVSNRNAFEKIADYIHNNPVKAGLVTNPEEYQFSSYRNIHLGDGSLIVLDAWEG